MILLTGATCKVGGQVVIQLMAAGAQVRSLPRDPGPARPPYGADVVRGDLTQPDSLDDALDGVESAFLVWPTLAADHAALATLERIAKQAGRIVYLSANGTPDEPPTEEAQTILESHAMIEHLIRRTGREWTFLRSGGFAGNTLAWAPQIRSGDVVRWVYGAAGRSLIHERDIAAVGVRVVTEDGHAGAKYVLTGPQTLTQIEQVHTIGAAVGRPLRFEEVPPEQAGETLFPCAPPSTLDAILSAHADMVTHPEPVSTTVEDITRHSAHTYCRWATDHANDFR